MSNAIRIKVEIDDDSINQKLSSLVKDDVTMLQVHNKLAQMCDPYVPFLEGNLSQTLDITPESVKYTVPYAHYQYTGLYFNFTRDRHPLASAYWDQAMMAAKGDEFKQQVKEILVERAKQL